MMARQCFLFFFLTALLLAWLGCAGPSPTCGRGTFGQAFCGDRLHIDRDYVYGDDPVFLRQTEFIAHRGGDSLLFTLNLSPNHSRGEAVTLRKQGIIIARYVGRNSQTDTVAKNAGSKSNCFADTAQPTYHHGSWRFGPDTTTEVIALSPKPRYGLAYTVVCREYPVHWGQVDTLMMPYRLSGQSDTAWKTFALPFHSSYHAPVVSLAIGTALIMGFVGLGYELAK